MIRRNVVHIPELNITTYCGIHERPELIIEEQQDENGIKWPKSYKWQPFILEITKNDNVDGIMKLYNWVSSNYNFADSDIETNKKLVNRKFKTVILDMLKTDVQGVHDDKIIESWKFNDVQISQINWDQQRHSPYPFVRLTLELDSVEYQQNKSYIQLDEPSLSEPDYIK